MATAHRFLLGHVANAYKSFRRKAAAALRSWSAASPAELVDLDEFYLRRCYGREPHIPGLAAATRKDLLALTVQRMHRSRFAAQFSFCPESFVLPFQLKGWRHAAGTAATTWIVKPPNESCGDGISVVGTNGVEEAAGALLDSGEMSVVVSRYINDPFLVYGHKFDLRLYSVVLCDGPTRKLRVFLHTRLGLARFATKPYDGAALNNLTAHLTNYSVNVEDPSFLEESRGSHHVHAPLRSSDSLDAHKWSLGRVLHALGAATRNVKAGAEILDRVAVMLARVVSAAQPDVRDSNGADNEQRFALVGVDVMIDSSFCPWLLEVQHRPSLQPSSKLDLERVGRVKARLLGDTRELLRRSQGGVPIARGEGGCWLECVWADAPSAVAVAAADMHDTDLRKRLHRENESLSYEAALLRGAVAHDGLWGA